MTYDYRGFDLSPPREKWTETRIDQLMLFTRNGNFEAVVGQEATEDDAARAKCSIDISHKNIIKKILHRRLLHQLLMQSRRDGGLTLGRVLVLGGPFDSAPVTAALALAVGAEKVTVVDWVGVENAHPKVRGD